MESEQGATGKTLNKFARSEPYAKLPFDLGVLKLSLVQL